jgi:hypothetical protein
MNKLSLGLAALICTTFTSSAFSDDRNFGGYACTEDCSGHRAGYLWAEARDVADPAQCPFGNSNSFYEGCLAYAEDPGRGADEDDEGGEIE